jgi:hypothetical protein
LLTSGILLSLQLWARLFEPGPQRQNIEQLLWPWPIMLGVLLLYCALVAFVRRRWLLGWLAVLVSVASSVIALLPILLQEAIYD